MGMHAGYLRVGQPVGQQEQLVGVTHACHVCLPARQLDAALLGVCVESALVLASSCPLIGGGSCCGAVASAPETATLCCLHTKWCI